MLAFVAVLVVLAVMGTALVQTTVWASHRATDRTQRADARASAEAAASLAAERLWTGFEAALAGDVPSPQAFRTYAATIGLLNQAGVALPARVDWRGELGLPLDAEGAALLGDSFIDELWLVRRDIGRAVRVEITATAAIHLGGAVRDDARASVTRIWSIEPPQWDGLDFALLANNVNCIMCHTEVDSAQRVYNQDPSLYGTFDRTRVGSIESFQFRDDPDSEIAGTLYIGGSAVDGEGNPITGWSGFPLMSADIDGFGHLVEDSAGALTPEHLSPADQGAPSPFENLYLDYFGFAEQIDGTLPDTFPPPFPDDGGYDLVTGDDLTAGTGNRVVDDQEFEATVATFGGGISGGLIGVVDPGDEVTTNGQLATLLSGNTTSLDPVTRGQVILIGTEEDPIRLDGKVAIDGDVIISGYVVGMGSLWARGNVYIPSDLRYLDGEVGDARTFGVGVNGAPNGLAITSGANIVIGDTFRAGWGVGSAVTGAVGGSWSFTLEEAGIFNRREWIKTQPELPGKPVRVQTGTVPRVDELGEWRGTGEFFDAPVYERRQTGTRPVAIYETRIITPATGYRPAVTERVLVGYRDEPVYENVQIGTEPRERQEWIVTGTNTVDVPVFEWVTPMYPNPEYAGPGYFARYYAFDSETVVPIYNKKGWFDPASGLWIADERTDGWDLSKLTLADPNDPSDPILFNADGTPRAAVSALTATDDWISDELLRRLMEASLAERDASEPFKIDATLYSANSIFGVIPNGDGTNGELEITGALIGADVGLLGPRGTRILYDARGKDLLDIRDPNRVGIFRLLAAPAPY
ncbi:MAG: hypothetical protein R3F49_08630 [Planctomycetota bacterium]